MSAAADEAVPLDGVGARAYLDVDAVVSAALGVGCDALHPGYGFLAESAELSRRCEEFGITFVGPTPDSLELFGDKARARSLAVELDVPVLPGTQTAVDLEGATEFFHSLEDGAAMVLKAVAGGGGRGMRVVMTEDQIAEAFERCQSEAAAAFGNGDLLVERLMTQARHVEVQIIGDGSGAVGHLGERECSLQRRHQKVVEWAPSPSLSQVARNNLTAAAVRLAQSDRYRSLGTFEFLVNADDDLDFAFIEANPRLQVEHTVTEEVTGVDIVRAQLRIAGGQSLAEIGLSQADIPPARGFAIQARVNMERMEPSGDVRPSGGTLTTFEPPSGPGVRVDTYGYPGYTTNPNFDSLLAKVIAYSASSDFADVIGRSLRALEEFRIEGVEANLTFLRQSLGHNDFASGDIYTRWVDDHVAELAAPPEAVPDSANGSKEVEVGLAGAQLDTRDPLAGLNYFREGSGTSGAAGRRDHGARRATNGQRGRSARNGVGPLAAAGHGHPDPGRGRRPGPRGSADVRDGLDEDGARRQLRYWRLPETVDRLGGRCRL